MFKLLKISLLTLFILPSGTKDLGRSVPHPLHVSTTEANFNSKERILEISSSLFIDDFENALKKFSKQKIDLVSPARHKEMDGIVKAYVLKNLKWQINGKIHSPVYLGFEPDQEVANVFLEIPLSQAIQEVRLQNTLLYDLFNDQISIIHVSDGKVRTSSKVAYPDNIFTAVF